MISRKSYWRDGHVPDYAAGFRSSISLCAAVLEGREPPNGIEILCPKRTLGEILGFPRGTAPELVRHYLSLKGQFGEIGTELIEQRDERIMAEYTKRRLRQTIRHKAARRKGQPSPLDVLHFVAAYEAETGETRGAAAAASRHFGKTRSRISKLLAVAETCRSLLESNGELFLTMVEGLSFLDVDQRALPEIIAMNEQILRKLPSRR
jgi:hypothetical protein